MADKTKKTTVLRSIRIIERLIEIEDHHLSVRQVFGLSGQTEESKEQSEAVLIDQYDEGLHNDLIQAHNILMQYSISRGHLIETDLSKGGSISDDLLNELPHDEEE